MATLQLVVATFQKRNFCYIKFLKTRLMVQSQTQKKTLKKTSFLFFNRITIRHISFFSQKDFKIIRTIFHPYSIMEKSVCGHTTIFYCSAFCVALVTIFYIISFTFLKLYLINILLIIISAFFLDRNEEIKRFEKNTHLAVLAQQPPFRRRFVILMILRRLTLISMGSPLIGFLMDNYVS